MKKQFNTKYTGEYTSQIAFPMGGIGAGMICLAGNGMLTSVSIDNRPQLFCEPNIFAALNVGGNARVLEGPIPWHKISGSTPGAGNGLAGKNYGLPRFCDCSFSAEFPFGHVQLTDDDICIKVSITGWSPFIPSDPDDSSLPGAALEYTFENTSDSPVEAMFSYHAAHEILQHPVRGDRRLFREFPGGFIIENTSEDGGKRSFAITTDQPDTSVNCRWLRSGWWDPMTALWRNIASGRAESNPPYPPDEDNGMGASLYLPLKLTAGDKRTVVIRLCWYAPKTSLQIGEVDRAVCGDIDCGFYSPWYSAAFPGIESVVEYFDKNYSLLRERTERFASAFYDTTLPDCVTEAVAANLSIIKSPTVLRQQDGRLWTWEGCCDSVGCCHGSCTHVWNYAFAIPNLFPSLERTLRETEYTVSQNVDGHQIFRANLPISPAVHNFHAASDGQLGGIMKVYREWRISGNTPWLRRLFPRIKDAMDYCLRTWDPDGRGVLTEPHHNTYDIEFWGPDVMCSSFYLGALCAMIKICEFLGEDKDIYEDLYQKGRYYCEHELFNGEYFYQRVLLDGLHASPDLAMDGVPAEIAEIIRREGPKYQYGTGCISDGVIGCYMAQMCGLGDILDPAKVTSHLKSVYKYNFRRDLTTHANPQRSTYALRDESGLLLCSWPRGAMPTLPFPYSNEVWTGIEYQVASHMAAMGLVRECVDIVGAARSRYDGKKRNPYNEFECGHWYARAMASYALIAGLTGIRYDAVDKTLYVSPSISGDFRSFLCAESGYGIAGIKDGKVFVEVSEGNIVIEKIEISGKQEKTKIDG